MTPDDIEDDSRRHKRHSAIQLVIYNKSQNVLSNLKKI